MTNNTTTLADMLDDLGIPSQHVDRPLLDIYAPVFFLAKTKGRLPTHDPRILKTRAEIKADPQREINHAMTGMIQELRTQLLAVIDSNADVWGLKGKDIVTSALLYLSLEMEVFSRNDEGREALYREINKAAGYYLDAMRDQLSQQLADLDELAPDFSDDFAQPEDGGEAEGTVVAMD